MMTAFTPVLLDMNSEVTRSAPSKKWMQSKVWTAAVKRTLTFIIHNLTIVACVHACLGLFVEHSRRHVQVFFAGVVRKFLLHGALECRRVHVLEGDILHHLQVLDFCTCIF